MEKLRITYTHGDAVARITLQDGSGNVLDQVMMEELHGLLESFKTQPKLKLITFEGAGGNFSFGASVAEHTKEKAPQMLTSFHGLFKALIGLSVPTAARVRGQCLGGGMELAIVCNFIFADASAVFSQPEIILGVFPPPASIILPMKIGAARAEDILLTGRRVKADEALQIGLVNKVFSDDDDMEKGVDEWIDKHISGKSAISLRYAVRAGRSAFNKTLLGHLDDLERMYVGELMETADANEGIASFMEKRKPVWKGL